MDKGAQTNTFLDSFKQAWTEEGDGQVDYFAGKTPPTTAPFINELIGAGLALIDGAIDDDRYRKTLDLTVYRLEESMKVFMEYFNLAEIPDEVKEEAAKALAAFNDQKAALAECEKYFADRSTSHITAGNDMTVKAAESLIASYEHFGSMAQEYYKIECLKCGHRNAAENKFCEKCKAEIILPKVSEAASLEMSFNDVNSMPPNFAVIFEAAEKLKSGQTQPAEFGAAVDQFLQFIQQQKPGMEKILRDDIKGIQPEVIGEELYQHFKELAEQMLGSIEATAAGLVMMKGFVTSGNQADIASGWERMLTGGREMQRVTKAMSELMERESRSLQAEAQPEAVAAPPEESVVIRGDEE